MGMGPWIASLDPALWLALAVAWAAVRAAGARNLPELWLGGVRWVRSLNAARQRSVGSARARSPGAVSVNMGVIDRDFLDASPLHDELAELLQTLFCAAGALVLSAAFPPAAGAARAMLVVAVAASCWGSSLRVFPLLPSGANEVRAAGGAGLVGAGVALLALRTFGGEVGVVAFGVNNAYAELCKRIWEALGRSSQPPRVQGLPLNSAPPLGLVHVAIALGAGVHIFASASAHVRLDNAHRSLLRGRGLALRPDLAPSRLEWVCWYIATWAHLLTPLLWLRPIETWIGARGASGWPQQPIVDRLRAMACFVPALARVVIGRSFVQVQMLSEARPPADSTGRYGDAYRRAVGERLSRLRHCACAVATQYTAATAMSLLLPLAVVGLAAADGLPRYVCGFFLFWDGMSVLIVTTLLPLLTGKRRVLSLLGPQQTRMR